MNAENLASDTMVFLPKNAKIQHGTGKFLVH